MIPISVVIISKNVGYVIEKTFISLQGLTDDIILVDSGSTDNTIYIAEKFNAKVIHTNWEGYGPNKNKGISYAKYNWILSLDADELIDDQLYQSLSNTLFFNENIAYKFKFKVFMGDILLKYGQPGNVKKIRLFNKKKSCWNDDLIHEGLMMPDEIKIETIKGNILHYSYKDLEHCMMKTNAYTSLMAQQMFLHNRKYSFVKLYVNPIYAFIRSYIFKLGFLDGFWGFTYASLNSFYCYMKYAKLKELKNREIVEIAIEEKYRASK